jgi:hypothetical protein
MLPTEQSGADSCRVPEQLLPGLPAGASVVTGTPFTKHGTAPVEPPVQVGGSGQGTVFVTATLVTELSLSLFATVKLQLKGTPAAWGLVGQVLVTPMPAMTHEPAAPEMAGVSLTEGLAGAGALSWRPQPTETNATPSNTAERTQ